MAKLWENKKATTNFYKAMKAYGLTPENSNKVLKLWNQGNDGTYHVVNQIAWGYLSEKVKTKLEIEQGNGINWKYIKFVTSKNWPFYGWLKVAIIILILVCKKNKKS